MSLSSSSSFCPRVAAACSSRARAATAAQRRRYSRASAGDKLSVTSALYHAAPPRHTRPSARDAGCGVEPPFAPNQPSRIATPVGSVCVSPVQSQHSAESPRALDSLRPPPRPESPAIPRVAQLFESPWGRPETPLIVDSLAHPWPTPHRVQARQALPEPH